MIGALNKRLSSKSKMPPMPGKKLPGILHASLALEKRFNQIADDGGGTQNNSENDGVNPIHAEHFVAKKMHENQARTVETKIAPPKPSQVLPGLMRGIILCLPMSEPTTYAPISLNFVTRMK